MRLLSIASVVVLTACSPSGESSADGSQKGPIELIAPGRSANPGAQAVKAAVRARFPETAALLSAGSAENCQPGRVGAREVQLCEYCVTAVVAAGDPLPYGHVLMRQILVVRERYKAPFARALSIDQPDVEPASDNGVWVMVGEFTPVSNGQSSQAEVPFENLRQMGFEVSSHPNISYGGSHLEIRQGDIRLTAQEFAANLLKSPNLTPITGLVAACT